MSDDTTPRYTLAELADMLQRLAAEDERKYIFMICRAIVLTRCPQVAAVLALRPRQVRTACDKRVAVSTVWCPNMEMILMVVV